MPRSLVTVIAAAIVLVATPVGATEVSIEMLLADPTSYEGEVTVRGEFVGDYGFRGDGWVWTQLNGDSYAERPLLEGGELTGGNNGVGVRVPDELMVGLGPPGGYRQHGPVVEVTGIWRYHDPGRGGESDIEVANMVVVQPARALAEDPHWLVLGTGVALLLLAGALWLRRMRESSSR